MGADQINGLHTVKLVGGLLLCIWSGVLDVRAVAHWMRRVSWVIMLMWSV